ncbi:MAG: HD domain-containing protein [Planctomycetes bacterium]|nr:HD domain-containing protein [Planctomycetota bacterium]
MNEPRRYSVVRDPVHGDLYLSSEEMALLDTPQMQRLRGVRQLGTAYLVYPGAQHTRFEHSLGTAHVASRLIAAINQNRKLRPEGLLGIAEDEERILRAAALVHDVTHIPSGHNIEDVRGIMERHDTAPRYLHALDEGNELGAQLARMGIRREVLAVLLPEGTPGLPAVPACWRELLSDTICADLLDYLKRDAYFTGLNLAYDERVLSYFMVDRASGHLFVEVEKRGLVREDILSELLRVLEARYIFSERVYYHHAKVAAGAMVAQVVETALLHGGLRHEQLFDLTDAELLPLLERHVAAPTAASTIGRGELFGTLPGDVAQELARARELVTRLKSRRLLKRACVWPLYANRAVQQELLDRFFAPGKAADRQAFEREVRLRLRRAGHDAVLVQLYCPSRKMQLKEAQTHVRFPGAAGIQPLASFADRLPRLADLERSYRDLWKLYLFAASEDPAVLAAIANIAAELLPNAVNVYQPR